MTLLSTAHFLNAAVSSTCPSVMTQSGHHSDPLAIALAFAAEPSRPCLAVPQPEPAAIQKQVSAEPAVLPPKDPTAPEIPLEPVYDPVPQIVSAMADASANGGFYGARIRLSGIGMPKNSRQSSEGYWIGARPALEQIDEMYSRDIRLVISASVFSKRDYNEISTRMEELGMEHLNIPFGGRFPNPERFMSIVRHYEPHQVYIHCEHGGDRSGAILAYLLIVQHHWTIPRALLAVAFPGKHDAPAMVSLLQRRGFEVSQKDIDEVLGIYSGESNDGYGGLKVRSDGYLKLINTTIDASMRFVRTHAQQEI